MIQTLKQKVRGKRENENEGMMEKEIANWRDRPKWDRIERKIEAMVEGKGREKYVDREWVWGISFSFNTLLSSFNIIIGHSSFKIKIL